MTTPFRGFDGAGPNRAAGTPDAPGAGRAGTDGFASGPGPSATRNQAGSGTGPGLPRISLPAGGGAIRGIDEKLTIGQATGAASLAVAVPTSPARQGFSPQLQLSYDSGAGNGPFGLGWRLPVATITRQTSPQLPRYHDAEAEGVNPDVFILSGAEDLVPLLRQTAAGWLPDASTVVAGAATYAVRRYRPRVESGFARIERWTDTATGDEHWRTVTRGNVTSLYGRTPAAG